MAVRDKVIGLILMVMGASIFLYYTTWVVILPFIPEEAIALHALFPAQTYATAIPATILTIAITSFGIVASVFIIREASSGKQKQK